MSKKTRKKPNRARRSSPKIRYETGGRNLTSQAGLIPVIKFLDGLGFSGLFHQVVRHERQPNARYLLGEAVFLVLIRLVPVDNSLIFINFMNRLRAKRTDSLTNRFFLLSIRPV